jgi:hypothetical protein
MPAEPLRERDGESVRVRIGDVRELDEEGAFRDVAGFELHETPGEVAFRRRQRK